MTGPAGLSYGRLITTALLELSHALSVPTRPISARQAVSAAQARHRIYRTTARILHTCMVGLDRAGADRAARLSQAERRGIARLHPQLAASFAGTSQVITLVGSPAADGSIADRLTRAADAAGLAWGPAGRRPRRRRQPDRPHRGMGSPHGRPGRAHRRGAASSWHGERRRAPGGTAVDRRTWWGMRCCSSRNSIPI